MTIPVLDEAAIPFSTAYAEGDNPYLLSTDVGEFTVTPVSMGNPHGVIFVDDLLNLDVVQLGSTLTAHPAFPEQANIGFCQVIDRNFIRLRVFERGAGETLACGTGACAAVVAAIMADKVADRVKVSLPGGKLRIRWPGPGEPITMAAGATLVFEGQLTVP